MPTHLYKLAFLLFTLSASACDQQEAAVLNPDRSDITACKQADIFSIEVPAGSDAKTLFRYQFRFRAPASPEMPTIVQIPGGPGSTSIGNEVSHRIPDEYGLLQTDPRGVGCNRIEPDYPLEFFRSEAFASDIVAAIGHVQLKDYVLYGHSYGTLLASVVADKLDAQSEIPAPRAIILEGVLGRAFRAEEWPGQSYSDLWAALKQDLPEDVIATLDSPRPLGLSSQQWGAFLMAILTAGSEDGQHPVQTALFEISQEFADLTDTKKEDNEAALAEQIASIATQYADSIGNTVHIQSVVACREITDQIPADNIDAVLVGGALVPSPDIGSLCSDLTLDTAFDTKNYTWTAPTYYFVGSNDPATPPWQAQHHFDSNTHSPRTMITVIDGGHGPLRHDLPGCNVAVLRSIAEGLVDLSDSLDECGPDRPEIATETRQAER